MARTAIFTKPAMVWMLLLLLQLAPVHATSSTFGKISELRLVQARTGAVVGTLINGGNVYLNNTNPSLTIVAVPDRSNGPITRVQMRWDKFRQSRTESIEPYTLCGGTYGRCRRLTVGTHTVSAKVVGSSDAPYSVRFSIVKGVAPPTIPTSSPVVPKTPTSPQSSPVAPIVSVPTPMAVAPMVTAPAPASVPSPVGPPSTKDIGPIVQAPMVVAPVSKAPVSAATPTIAPAVAITPTSAPIKAPMTSPVVSTPTSTVAPAAFSSSQAPAAVPNKSPVNPASAPGKVPTMAPAKSPTQAPVKPQTKAPVSPPTNVPTKAPTKAPVVLPTKKPSTKAPVQSNVGTVKLTVVSLSLGGTNTTLVNDGIMEYDLYAPYTIMAEFVDPGVESVKFTYDGNFVRIEDAAPYLLAANRGREWLPWIPTPGPHTLVVTAYSRSGGAGALVAATTVSFTAVLQKDVTVPWLLSVKTRRHVNRLDPPSTLDLSLVARDESSGIARATATLFKPATEWVCCDGIVFASTTVQFDSAITSSTQGRPFYFNLSMPFPTNIPPGSYRYRFDIEDGAGNIYNSTRELWDRDNDLVVNERRVELLNVQSPSTVTMNASGLPAQVPVQITLTDDDGYRVCVSASGNGFDTKRWTGAEPFRYVLAEDCVLLPSTRRADQIMVANVSLEIQPYFPSGAYGLTVYSWDYSFESAYLSSKTFASVINLVNPNVMADWKPPQIKSLTALSSTTFDFGRELYFGKEAYVTIRLVLQDTVSGFDGDVDFLWGNWLAATVSTKNMTIEAGQPLTFDVDLPFFGRPGKHPLSLGFQDKFRNVANVSAASLVQQGFPIVVHVKTNSPSAPPLLYFTCDFKNKGFGVADVSFGYRYFAVSYEFQNVEWNRYYDSNIDGYLTMKATGASESNRGVVLEARRSCPPSVGSDWYFARYDCFLLDDSAPPGLYLLSADLGRGVSYDAQDLARWNTCSNFTVTSYMTTGLGP